MMGSRFLRLLILSIAADFSTNKTDWEVRWEDRFTSGLTMVGIGSEALKAASPNFQYLVSSKSMNSRRECRGVCYIRQRL